MAFGRGAFATEHFKTLGLVGAGAVGGAMIQSSGIIPLSGNIRDVVLLVLASVGMGMGGHAIRAFSVGIGAAAIVTLVGRNFPNLVSTGGS